MSDLAQAGAAAPARQQSKVLVIGASSLGTMFEWYDFFLYGALAVHIAAHFFTAADETSAFIFALAAFAAGFLVRPFGALVFGRVGDIVGRKRTFLVTMTLMGVATFLVGVLPGYGQIGIAAPIILVGLRLLQGLALGGEYGGAAIYVAEHAPAGKRGLHTSWINAMATGGLLLSLLVIMGVRASMSPEDFAAWGWRVPFILSVLLLGVSLWVRLMLEESPVFQRMKDEAATSRAPLAESFASLGNMRFVVAAFFVAVGLTVLWYTAHFYTLFFLERVLKVEALTANMLIAISLAIAAPTYMFFGWLSDRVGRKPIALGALVLGSISFFPAFHMLTSAANPALAAAQERAPVVVVADPVGCSFQFDPLGRTAFDEQSCDVAKSFLSKAGVSYANETAPAGAPSTVRIGAVFIAVPETRDLSADDREAAVAAFQTAARDALDGAGYPAKADAAQVDHTLVVAIVAYLAILAAMGYAPVAALLVELFPARIRYTSMSFPYHLGTGWVGGLLPTTAFAIVAATGDIYSGLWYPIVFASLALVVCLLILPETKGRPIDH